MVNTKGLDEGVVIYKSDDGSIKLDIKLQNDSVWLNQYQIASLFGVKDPAISKHIKNIFQSGELSEKGTVSKMETVQDEGGRKVNRILRTYNLDIVISVGYRVNSKKATQFRIWATKILKDHLLKGYSVNQKLLLSQRNKFKELQTTINFLEGHAKDNLLRSQGLELLSLVKDYTRSLNLLEQYDNKKIHQKKGLKVEKPITLELANKTIAGIRDSLSQAGRDLGLLGVDTGNKIDSIIKNLNQTFAGEELYPTIEERSASLLYLIIKDHPFLDGNKRIGSILFITYLDHNNYLYRSSGERKINDNAIVALALLVAISPASEKDLIIDLVKSLIQ